MYFCLASFNQCNYFYIILSLMFLHINGSFFNGWVVFYCMDIKQFVHPFACLIDICFQFGGYYKQSYHEHSWRLCMQTYLLSLVNTKE